MALCSAVLVFVASVGAAAAMARERSLLTLAGAGLDQQALSLVDDARRVLAPALMLWLVTWLLLVVALAVFLRTAYRTAQWLGLGPLRYGPVWAVLGWFTPFVSLVVPGRIVGDLWRASASDPARRRPVRLVVTWWCFYLGSTVLIQVGANLYAESDTFATGPVRVLVIGFALQALAALLSIAVVAGLVLRLRSTAHRSGRTLPSATPRALVERDQQVPTPAVAALSVVALVICLVGVSSGGRELARVPADVRLAAAQSEPPPVEQPPGTPSRTGQDPAPVATAPPDLTLEASMLVPPGFVRSEGEAGGGLVTLDKAASLSAADPARVDAVRDELGTRGFRFGQNASWQDESSVLVIEAYEWTTADAAQAWPSTLGDTGEPFPLLIDGGYGAVERGPDGTFTVAGFSVGTRSYVLAFGRFDDQPDIDAVQEFARQQHAVATGQPA